jgi:DNA-binding MarR family transcriptional regulator
MHRLLHGVVKSSRQDTRKNGSNVPEMVADRTARPLKLEEFLPYRLAVLSSVVSDALSQIYAHHRLGMAEWFVLMTLGGGGVHTAKALGAACRMHKTKVSRAVAGLLARDLITRRPNRVDLRQAFLSLTPLGQDVYAKSLPLAADFVQRLEDAVPAADREILHRSLAKLAARSQQLISGRPSGPG